jgi:hypothetical protein
MARLEQRKTSLLDRTRYNSSSLPSLKYYSSIFIVSQEINLLYRSGIKEREKPFLGKIQQTMSTPNRTRGMSTSTPVRSAKKLSSRPPSSNMTPHRMHPKALSDMGETRPEEGEGIQGM